jgi:hypothetical protein
VTLAYQRTVNQVREVTLFPCGTSGNIPSPLMYYTTFLVGQARRDAGLWPGLYFATAASGQAPLRGLSQPSTEDAQGCLVWVLVSVLACSLSLRFWVRAGSVALASGGLLLLCVGLPRPGDSCWLQNPRLSVKTSIYSIRWFRPALLPVCGFGAFVLASLRVA